MIRVTSPKIIRRIFSLNGLPILALPIFLVATNAIAQGLPRETSTAVTLKGDVVEIGGLVWMKCSVGQTWSGDTCIGIPEKLTLGESSEYAKRLSLSRKDGQWRVPTIQELSTLLACSSKSTRKKDVVASGDVISSWCDGEYQRPTINVDIFPNTAASYYWSSSLSIKRGLNWGLNFEFGVIADNYDPSVRIHTRLVASPKDSRRVEASEIKSEARVVPEKEQVDKVLDSGKRVDSGRDVPRNSRATPAVMPNVVPNSCERLQVGASVKVKVPGHSSLQQAMISRLKGNSAEVTIMFGTSAGDKLQLSCSALR